jgi:virginiamycin B lyase
MSATESRIVEHVISGVDEGPYAVAVTADGAVWCTLVHGGAVVRFEPGGADAAAATDAAGATDVAGAGGSITRIALGEGSQPSQLAIVDDTSVWVTDTSGNRLVMLGPVTGHESAFGVQLSVDVPTPGAQPFGITSLHDGTVWFTELGLDSLGCIGVLGGVVEFPAGTDEGVVSMIASSGDSLWFTANQANAIGYIRGGDSAVQLFEVPTPHAGPVGITVGDDGAAWFVEIVAGAIGRVDRNGRFTEFPLPWSESKPHAICVDPAGGCWFTLWGSNQLGHITLEGEISLVDLSDTHSEPHGLAVAPDGTIWVAMESGALLAVTP